MLAEDQNAAQEVPPCPFRPSPNGVWRGVKLATPPLPAASMHACARQSPGMSHARVKLRREARHPRSRPKPDAPARGLSLALQLEAYRSGAPARDLGLGTLSIIIYRRNETVPL